MNIQQFTCDVAGKTLTIETGRYGPQSDAALTVKLGETVVLCSANMSPSAREGMDFFPLMVEYEERYYACGRIKGSRFTKREGRPSLDAVLTGRSIDRGIRPLFDQNMRNEVQVICMPLTFDEANKPDVPALIGGCMALHLSTIPFDGPVAGVRIGYIDGRYIVNPTVEELETSTVDLLVTGDGSRITMVECDCNEAPDDVMVGAFEEAMKALGPLCAFIEDVRQQIGKPKAKREDLKFTGELAPEEKVVADRLKERMIPHLQTYVFNQAHGSKGERKEIMKEMKELVVNDMAKEYVNQERDEEAAKAYLKGILGKCFQTFIDEQVTRALLDREQRVDGRKTIDIRHLAADVAVLPRLHGTGFFRRGETHILSVVTLGAPGDTLIVESMEDDIKKRYFHHYNFPPFSVGEVKKLRGAGRREQGHGMLAEKALRPVLPTLEEFPYTIRMVSEVMSSNGSSSMGSTCASTLALMDAGVPIKKPVAGIAIGLASDGERWKVITDIQDMEDGDGGMDFKITATRDGVTAVQMDTKTRGISMPIIREAVSQGRMANNFILNVINGAIVEPRKELSAYAPRIIAFKIDPEKIGAVIGPGGKMIRSITDETGVQMDIEDDGTVMITTNDAEMAAKAEKAVKEIVREVAVGEIFEEAKVVTIKPFGAFVNLIPGKDGMLHISELEYGHVDKIEDRVKLGDKVKVVVTKVAFGKVDVSMKALHPPPPGWVEPERPRRTGGRDRDRRGGGRDRDRRGGGRDRR